MTVDIKMPQAIVDMKQNVCGKHLFAQKPQRDISIILFRSNTFYLQMTIQPKSPFAPVEP